MWSVWVYYCGRCGHGAWGGGGRGVWQCFRLLPSRIVGVVIAKSLMIVVMCASIALVGMVICRCFAMVGVAMCWIVAK